jgi:hypothetical protein
MLKFLALQGAPLIFDISSLRVNAVLTILHALKTPVDILPIVSFIVVLGAKYSKFRLRNMSQRSKYIVAALPLFNGLFNICCPGFCCTVLCKALLCVYFCM